MSRTLAYVLLAVLWMALTGWFSLTSFFVGLVFARIAFWVSPATRPLVAGRRPFRTFRFILFYAWEMLLSALRIAWDVVTPEWKMRPGIVAVPISVEDENAITLLANLISLTPGTLTLDVSPDRRTLYVHGMFVSDPEQFRASIRDLERRVVEVLQ